MKYSELSAIDLQREIDRAEYYSEDNGPELFDALKEVGRLRAICRDIIEVIGVEYPRMDNADSALSKIDDIAHKYFTG